MRLRVRGGERWEAEAPDQHAMREAPLSLLAPQGTELVYPKVLDPQSNRSAPYPC